MTYVYFCRNMQVEEIYTSGGDLHLELPTGEREASRELWVSSMIRYGCRFVVYRLNNDKIIVIQFMQHHLQSVRGSGCHLTCCFTYCIVHQLFFFTRNEYCIDCLVILNGANIVLTFRISDCLMCKEIPPFETKSIMRASFVGRVESNHTAFIRIRTNKENKQQMLIVPVEVEVTSGQQIIISFVCKR